MSDWRGGGATRRWIALGLVAVLLAAGALAAVVAWPSIVQRLSEGPDSGTAQPVSAIVVGDASTGCTAASGCGPDSWVGRAAEELGWSVRYLPGRGYIAGIPDDRFSDARLQVGGLQPDVVIIAGGDADSKTRSSTVARAVESTASGFAEILPTGVVIVMPPYSAAGSPAVSRRNAEAIAAGARAGGALLVTLPSDPAVEPDAAATAAAAAITAALDPEGGPVAAAATAVPDPECTPETEPLGQRLPAPEDIDVAVLNAGAEDGSATTTSQDLAERGFVISRVANDPAGRLDDAAAEVRFGPKGKAAARRLAAEFPDVVLVRDDRTDRSLDLALGPGYEGLAPVEEVEQALARQVKVPGSCS